MGDDAKQYIYESAMQMFRAPFGEPPPGRDDCEHCYCKTRSPGFRLIGFEAVILHICCKCSREKFE